MNGDSRFQQAAALIDDARALIADVDEEGGHSPVDTSRLRQTRQHLDTALATLAWFTTRYPDDRTAS